MYPLPLEAFACLEVWLLGHDGSVLLSEVAQALLCIFLCASSSSSLLFGDANDGSQWKSRLLSAGFHTEPCHRRRVVEGGVHLPGVVNVLDHRVKRFRKHIISFEKPYASYHCNI
jgi:hypothetical protein